MASRSDGTNNRERRTLHSDELLHLPFKSENSKFLITEERKSDNSGPSKIFKVETSSVLKRVKDFLPKMQEAEKALEKEFHEKPASEINIEHVDDNAPYIEMSLALMETQENSNEDSQEESDYKEEEDCDEIQTQEIDCGHITEENFVISKTVKGHIKPFIEVISTEERSSVKKNKKGVASKKASRKRKR